MPVSCEYCRSACEDGAVKCPACGAPLSASAEAPDFRFCPHCRRRLLALGSPACNYCERPLPEAYLRARGAALQRIREASAEHSAPKDLEELTRESDDTLRRALGALFKLDGMNRRG